MTENTWGPLEEIISDTLRDCIMVALPTGYIQTTKILVERIKAEYEIIPKEDISDFEDGIG